MTKVISIQKLRSEVIGQCHRGQTQLNRFRTVTPVWIHIWWQMRCDAWSSIEEMPYCFWRSYVKFEGHRGHKKSPILTQIGRFRTVTLVWILRWVWNDAVSLKQHRRSALLFFKVICQISRSQGTKIVGFDPKWAFPDCNTSLNSQMGLK